MGRKKDKGLHWERRMVIIAVPVYSAIGVDTYDCLERNIQYLVQKEVEVAVVKSRGTYVHDARNNCVKQSYNDAWGFTHLMFIDGDMTFNPDLVYNLLERRKDIVGGCYVQKSYPFYPNAGILQPDGVRYKLTAPDYTGKSGDLLEVDMIGTGLMMIRRTVFDKMDWPWFEFLKEPCPPGKEEQLTRIHTKKVDIIGEDVSFCRKARAMGFKVHLDLKNQGAHQGNYGYELEDYLAPDKEKAAEVEEGKSAWVRAGGEN